MDAVSTGVPVLTPAPGPKTKGLSGLLFGHMPDFRKDRLPFFLNTAQEHGKLVAYRFAHLKGFLINDATIARRVLLDNASNYDKQTPGYLQLKRLLGDGLFTSNGELWKRQRVAMGPCFHHQALKHYSNVIERITDEWVADAKRNGTTEIDVGQEMMALTVRMVGECLLGSDMKDEIDGIWAVVPRLVAELDDRISNVGTIPEWIPTSRNRAFRALLADLDRVVKRILTKERPDTGEPRKDILSILLSMRDSENGDGLSAQQIRDELMTILLAGHETTALGLVWTYCLLSEHSEAEEKLVKSARRGGSYAKQVFQEAIRLYPPLWMVDRRAIGSDELGGHPIPAGSLILISPYVLHRNSAYWKNPEEFDPERFAEGARYERYAYLPFGAGTRSCIGSNLALLEAQVVLSRIADAFSVQPLPGTSFEAESRLTLRPKHPIRARLTRRAPAWHDARLNHCTSNSPLESSRGCL